MPINSTTYEEVVAKILESARKNPSAPINTIVVKSGCGWNTVIKYIGHADEVAALIQANKPKRNTTKIPVEELWKDIKNLALQHPDIEDITKLLTYGKYSESTYRRRVGTIGTIRKIVKETREQAHQNKIQTKRYPIKFFPSSTNLKWSRKRYLWNG